MASWWVQHGCFLLNEVPHVNSDINESLVYWNPWCCFSWRPWCLLLKNWKNKHTLLSEFYDAVQFGLFLASFKFLCRASVGSHLWESLVKWAVFSSVVVCSASLTFSPLAVLWLYLCHWTMVTSLVINIASRMLCLQALLIFVNSLQAQFDDDQMKDVKLDCTCGTAPFLIDAWYYHCESEHVIIFVLDQYIWKYLNLRLISTFVFVVKNYFHLFCANVWTRVKLYLKIIQFWKIPFIQYM